MNISKISKSNILYVLRLLSRYYIAYKLFSYAFAKILQTQFDLGVIYTADENISNYNGFMLTWHYYGYSRTYGLIIAGTQIATALLLLFRKTERLGVVLLLSFMVNIVLVDIFYGIDAALWMAVTLAGLGVFLLLSDWKGFTTYFLRSKDTVSTIPAILPQKWHRLYWLKFLIIGFMVYHTYQYIANIKTNYLSPNELYGVWRNVSGYRSDRIHKISFGYHNGIKIRDFNNTPYYGNTELDTVANSFTINARHYGDGVRYFLKDSIQKLPEHQQDNDSIQQAIKDYYHTLTKSLPFENQKYTYHIQADTLLLRRDSIKLRFVNITSDYIQD